MVLVEYCDQRWLSVVIFLRIAKAHCKPSLNGQLLQKYDLMSIMFSLIPTHERETFIPLFQSHRHMRSTLNRILKHGAGDLYVSKNEFAIASLDSCTYLAGSVKNSAEIVRVLTELKNPYRFLFNDKYWKDFLLNYYLNRASVDVREAFSSEFLCTVDLEFLIKQVPSGYILLEVDRNLASQCDPNIFPILQRELGTLGYGFAVLRGKEVVSIATPADVCDKLVEVQVNTHPEHQRRGLATIASAAFINHCLKNSYDLDWDAKDEVSSLLAKKLGFQSLGKYEVINLATR